MKAKAGKNGGARLSFTDVERQTLASMLGDLAEALAEDGLQREDPVYQRLYPDGYSGPVEDEVQQEFRGLTETGLREQRIERVTACSDELLAAADGRVEIDQDGFDRWLRVLNDVRLAIGTRLNISEDDEHWDIDPTDPSSAAYLLYGWLTEVQDTVVRLALK